MLVVIGFDLNLDLLLSLERDLHGGSLSRRIVKQAFSRGCHPQACRPAYRRANKKVASFWLLNANTVRNASIPQSLKHPYILSKSIPMATLCSCMVTVTMLEH